MRLVPFVLSLALPAAASCSAAVPSGHGGAAVHPRARAFRIDREADLLRGPAATGRLGDYRLDNGVIAVIVDRIDDRARDLAGMGFALSGGSIIDAARIDGAGQGEDELGQIFAAFGEFPRQAIYERAHMRVDGDRAILAVDGRDSLDPDVFVTTEYVLGPWRSALGRGVRHDVLRIRTSFENRGRRPYGPLGAGDAIQWGAAEHWVPGVGATLPRRVRAPYVVGLGLATTYGYFAPGAPIETLNGVAWSDPVVRDLTIAPGGRDAYERILLVGGPADTSALARETCAACSPLRLSVLSPLHAGSAPAPGSRVDVSSAAGGVPVAVVTTDARGAAEAWVDPATGPLTARATRPGQSSDAVRTGAGEAPTLRLSPAGRIAFTIRNADGASAAAKRIAGKVVVDGVGGTPTPDLGPSHRAEGGRNVVFTHDGRGEALLAPGRYRVTAAHGPEWTIETREVVVPPGGAVAADFALRRVVDTRGFVAADLHQHVAQSIDASATIRGRVVSNVAEGLEVVASTDHNFVNDFGPEIRALGLAGTLFAMSGDEVSTDASAVPVGHFNVFPLAPDSTSPRAGALAYLNRTPSQIFAYAGDRDGAPIVQVNHPRSDRNGYFDLVGFDPRTATGGPLFDPRFDAMEIWNGRRQDMVPPVLADFFGLLRHGLAVTATGNSDAHTIVGYEGGYPRNLIAVPDDDPARVRPAWIVEALRRTRNVIVTNGPVVRLTIDGAPVGGFVRALRGRDGRATVRVALRVDAAPWVDVTRIELLANGEVVDTWRTRTPEPNRGQTPSVLRFENETSLALERDAFVLAIARGERSMAPVVVREPAETPLCVTNPIWIDVDGNGRFDPPDPPVAFSSRPPRPPSAAAPAPPGRAPPSSR